jgi:hypothetical protein
MDLPTKSNRMNKKIKVVKPDEHLIVDPILIALLEYMLNPTYNPGDMLFNKPQYHQSNRDRKRETFLTATISFNNEGTRSCCAFACKAPF